MEKEQDINLKNQTVSKGDVEDKSTSFFLSLIQAISERLGIANLPLKMKLQKSATTFLQAGMFEDYIEIMNRGYEPTKKQKKKWLEHIEKLAYNNRYEVIDNYLKLGAKFDFFFDLYRFRGFSQMVLKLTQENSDFLDSEKSLPLSHELPFLKNEIRYKVLSEGFAQEFNKMWVSNVKYFLGENRDTSFSNLSWGLFDKDPFFYRKIAIPLETFPQFLTQNLNYKEVTQRLIQLESIKNSMGDMFSSGDTGKLIIKDTGKNPQQYVQDIMDGFKKEVENLKNSHVKEIRENVSKVYLSQNIDEVLTQTTELVSKLKVVELPQEAQDIIQKIENTYNKILVKNGKDIAIEKLVIEQVPKIVRKYLTIDEDYRIKLRNLDNKNAQQLMIESLTEIELKVENAYEDINQSLLHSLSASNRHVSKM